MPENVSGPENVVACVAPVALVERSEPATLEMVRLDVDAVLIPVMLFPAARIAPPRVNELMVLAVRRPTTAVPIVAALEKKLVDEAVVAKSVVEVALPKITGCVSWYATDVVECAPEHERLKRFLLADVFLVDTFATALSLWARTPGARAISGSMSY